MSQTEPQPSSTHRFANEQGNAWCRHCGLSEAVHDLQADQPSSDDPRVNWGAEWYERDDPPTQPSRIEGAGLDLGEGERLLAALQEPGARDTEWVGWASDNGEALITALRQAQAQAEQREAYFVKLHRRFLTVIDEREQLQADLAAANEQRDQYIQWHHDVGTLLLAERERVRQLRASLEAAKELLSECVVELERLNKDHPLYEPTATTQARAWLGRKEK